MGQSSEEAEFEKHFSEIQPRSFASSILLTSFSIHKLRHVRVLCKNTNFI